MDCMVIYLKIRSIKLSFNFNFERFYNEYLIVKIRMFVENYVKKYIIGCYWFLIKMVFVLIWWKWIISFLYCSVIVSLLIIFM